MVWLGNPFSSQFLQFLFLKPQTSGQVHTKIHSQLLTLPLRIYKFDNNWYPLSHCSMGACTAHQRLTLLQFLTQYQRPLLRKNPRIISAAILQMYDQKFQDKTSSNPIATSRTFSICKRITKCIIDHLTALSSLSLQIDCI